jgi:uncharacterized protein
MTAPSHPGDLVPIGADECIELLRGAPFVRVAFVVDGAPTVLPVNVLLHDDAVFFRTATGSKLGTAAAGGPVAIEADAGDETTRIAWSVVVHGTASIVTDTSLEEALLGRTFEPWALPDVKHFWVRVDPHGITGRRIVRP